MDKDVLQHHKASDFYERSLVRSRLSLIYVMSKAQSVSIVRLTIATGQCPLLSQMQPQIALVVTAIGQQCSITALYANPPDGLP